MTGGFPIRALFLILLVVAGAAPSLLAAGASDPAGRGLQPVVLLGAQLGPLAVVANYVEHPPAPFAEEDRDGLFVPLEAVPGQRTGTPVTLVAGYHWESGAFVRIPLQVDERFPRYLTNYASGFGIYSQSDLEITYAFDWEGRKLEGERPDDPFTAAASVAGDITTADPVPGLDTDDEVVVMFSDAGERAPTGARPEDATLVQEVRILDPLDATERWIYVGRSATPTTFAPYVAYVPDEDAWTYVLSNHGDYGGAPGGACHLGDGVDADFAPTSLTCPHRRPKDSATVSSDRYRFHYAGRWKLDGLSVRQPDGSWSESVVDRWKGRAFQQREGNAADIGGFEDENDWSRSSVTLGVKTGPIRVIRETWGADSGTSVTRTDVFYRDQFVQRYMMRVHPIPPDGVYAFWDHRAGMMETYYTPARPGGVPIDGKNDELYGTNSDWQEDLLGASLFTIDAPDPTLQPLVADFAWDEATGPWATLVTYIATPAGMPSGALTPYYRDDSQFDDGTGSDPAPSGQGQGSFGAHGIHFFFTSDTDNLFLPAPVNEFAATVTQYVLAGGLGNVGDDIAALERAPLLLTPHR